MPLMPSARNRTEPSTETRLVMHRQMLRIRRVEETISRRYAEQEMRCPTHLCVGQEAVPVGVSAHLRNEDYVFSGHRSHGHYLAKGGDLNAMIAELYGRETGCALGRGGSQHLIDLDAGFVASAPILAGTVSIAVGAAFGATEKGEDRISVVFIGDGATEEGVFHEAMNFAAVHRLPVLFICENNLYSVHSAMDVRQPANRPVAEIGRAHAVPSVTADGNDIDEIWRQAKDAVARARAGEGPTLIEFLTYRWLEHCGPNDDTALDYRSGPELADWQDRCPIRLSEAGLRASELLDDRQVAAMEDDIAGEIETAFGFAKGSAFPDPGELMRFIYPE